jgi:2-amino-4-hydroxy-6-hydroxymethyldihydropteridine diphosphokinase
MARAFVSVGSNIDPEENTARALSALGREARITKISTVYLTEPEGRPEQPLFYNCVVEIETELSPVELKQKVLREIEKRLGRERTEDKYAARTIDLDLVLYDDLVMTTEGLTLPDPDIVRRPFLAVPLLELAPGLVLPGSGLRIAEAAAALQQNSMKPLKNYTERLRKEVLYGRKE